MANQFAHATVQDPAIRYRKRDHNTTLSLLNKDIEDL
jgi:hypothetical protein